MIIKIILSAVISYLLGSINSSILIGRLYGKDIRDHGSGNAGLTNAVRVLGKKAAVFVLFGDAAKGVIACLISALIINTDLFPAYIIGGFFAVAGHNWPVYFRFKGGKGALTAVSAAFMIDPVSALLLLAIFIAILLISRYVSLATILTCICYPVLSILITANIYVFVYALLISLMIIYRHRSNIKRLIKNEEPRINMRMQR
jgi:glycerol-3-phosphate acyltransferase PlsY